MNGNFDSWYIVAKMIVDEREKRRFSRESKCSHLLALTLLFLWTLTVGRGRQEDYNEHYSRDGETERPRVK